MKRGWLLLAACVLPGCSLDELTARCQKGDLTACEQTCDYGVRDERGCLALADARQEAAPRSTVSDSALELYESACAERLVEGCLKAAELIAKATQKLAPNKEENERMLKLRRELLGTACVLMPRSRIAREFEFRRQLNIAQGEHPTLSACRDLGRSWLGADDAKAERAFALACVEHPQPEQCATQMQEWQLHAKGLLDSCKPESNATRTAQELAACEALTELVDPLRAKQLDRMLCRARGRDSLPGGCERPRNATPVLGRALEPLASVPRPPPSRR